jgi:hypothetical protein
MIKDSVCQNVSNPFSSRFLEPGAIPFVFRDSESLASLADRIRSSLEAPTKHRVKLAIVGPHGTGKSTLLRHLSEHLDCTATVLHATSNKWIAIDEILKAMRRKQPCLIDGYEQLPLWGKTLLIARSKVNRVPLCVTSHRLPWDFELLWETRIDPQVETHVIDTLLADADPRVKSDLLDSQDWEKSRQKHRENLRESLFDMYDWWRDTVDEFSPSR